MRIKEGQDTMSVSGNVLRDYLNRLIPDFGTRYKRKNVIYRTVNEWWRII